MTEEKVISLLQKHKLYTHLDIYSWNAIPSITDYLTSHNYEYHMKREDYPNHEGGICTLCWHDSKSFTSIIFEYHYEEEEII